MPTWARQAIFYHIVIDRFATGARQFERSGHAAYDTRLRDWMGGTLYGIAASLDYLQELGVDALILTPFFEGKKYHGYWVTDFFQVDPHFGDVAALKRVIDAAHRRGMRIVMDLPITHCHQDNRAVPAHWLNRNDAGEVIGFYGDHRLPELDLDHREVTAFVHRVVDHWLGLGFDGIRFDHAKRPSDRFWRQVAHRLRENYPQLLLLGENWRESGEIGALSPYLHGELNIPLAGALRQFAQQPTARTLKAVFQRIVDQRPLRELDYILPAFLDNHDMERIGAVADTNRAHLALAYLVMLTLPFPCVIYYGSEAGQSQSDNLPPPHEERDRYFREPMPWPQSSVLTEWVKDLIAVRRAHQSWFANEPRLLDCTDTGLIAYRFLHRDAAITVVVNLSQHAAHLAVSSSQSSVLACVNGSGGQSQPFALNSYGAALLKHPVAEEPLALPTSMARVLTY